MTNQKKISKGDVVLAKDLNEDYWGSEIAFKSGYGGGVSCNWDAYNEGN